jgi:hypothetical protein
MPIYGEQGHSGTEEFAITEDRQLTPDSASADAPTFDLSIPPAPAWRRWLAHSIDLTIVLVVFALFLTPVIALYSRDASASTSLRVSAWVYVAVFVGLGVSLARGKRQQLLHVTVGMSIMDIRPVRTGKAYRFVSRQSGPETGGEDERHGMAMVAVAVPVLLLGAAFFVFELFAYL